MGKLKEVDIPVVVSLLQEGKRFGEIAEALEVSGPTLRKFMLDNDLYKFSTNENSLKISKSASKSNDDNTLKALIDDVMDHKNDLYDEDVEFLEDLLKKGTSIGKISRMYKRGRGTVREYLKKIGLYSKYCSENRFDNKSRAKQMQQERKEKEQVKSKNVTIVAKCGKENIPMSIPNNSELPKPIIAEKIKEIKLGGKQLSIEDLQTDKCIVNDVVLDYINKNMKKISLDARLEDMSNILMDKLISNFSEEELKDGDIKVEIKRTLIKLVEELL